MIVLYLESIGDGRQLMELARFSPKPIIVRKSNRGQASQAIALSHTAALAADDRIGSSDAASRASRPADGSTHGR
jgi:acyl-CoA synthetase (NDP forming)